MRRVKHLQRICHLCVGCECRSLDLWNVLWSNRRQFRSRPADLDNSLFKTLNSFQWTVLSTPGALYNAYMAISARNKLRGKIEEVQLGDIMAHVVVRVGDNLIESAITRRSADELKLKKGDTVTAVVKATEVMIQKD